MGQSVEPETGAQSASALDPVQKLKERAERAADIRAYSTTPDVIALRVERARHWFNVAVWIAVLAALAYTTTNVQIFAAAGAEVGSVRWWTAWLMDPMVTLGLVAILVGEQILSSVQIRTPRPAQWAKWFALASTYAMNTWTAWSGPSWSRVVLHSIPPLIAFMVVWAAPAMRDRLTDAVAAAVRASAAVPAPAVKPAPARKAPAADTSTSTPAHRSIPKPTSPKTPVDLEPPIRKVLAQHGGGLNRLDLMAAIRDQDVKVPTSRRTEAVRLYRQLADQPQPRHLETVGAI